LVEVSTIAIDGPVASGKTAVGQLVAKLLGFRFLDTGIMYRAVTFGVIQRQISLYDDVALTNFSNSIDIRICDSGGNAHVTVDGLDVTDSLRLPDVERGVSLVSKIPGVRATLVTQQRAIAAQGPIVMVGRDIGTVVLHDAQLKIYLNASIATRAERRFLELQGRGTPLEYDQVVKELQRRDKIDSERFDSPLHPDKNALHIDTDILSVEELAMHIRNLTTCQR
jgi:cytidylate kinase